jgi:hypothetical protein
MLQREKVVVLWKAVSAEARALIELGSKELALFERASFTVSWSASGALSER